MSITPDHDPCCSSHGVPMSCERYRRTHFVEVRPCCSTDAARLKEEAKLSPAGLKAAVDAAKEHAAREYPQTHRTDSSITTVFGIALTELLTAAIPAYNAAAAAELAKGKAKK